MGMNLAVLSAEGEIRFIRRVWFILKHMMRCFPKSIFSKNINSLLNLAIL